MFACNPVFVPVLNASSEVRYIHLWGGRGRGGSYFATEYALACLMDTVYFRGYLMRAVSKDIRGSLWRDLMDRMNDKAEQGQLKKSEFKINTVDMSVVYLPTGNTISSKGFRASSKGQTARMKSIAGATHVFVEEAEEINEDEFKQLDDSLRTTKGELRVVLIFNPPKKNHWIIQRWYTLTEARIPGYYIARPIVRSNFLSIFSTYHDNIVNIDQTTIDNYEAYYGSDPDWYWTVVRGLVSEGAKGRIFKNWKTITNAEFNALPYSSYYVLDFGFGGHPLSFNQVKRHNKKRWAKELIYETGVGDDELIRRLKAFKVGSRPIVADSAEPKSIAKLRNDGYNVIAARKAPDSIRAGIKTMQSQEWHYTEDSKNIAFEYQEYRWQLDADKNSTDEPEDKNNHCFPAGTLVATNKGQIPIENVQNGDMVLTRAGFRRVISAGITGFNRKVVEYQIGNSTIKCTPNHLIYTKNRGFIRAEHLTNYDTLSILDEEKYNKLWLSNSSTTVTFPTAVTLNPSVYQTADTSLEIQNGMENTPASFCIDGSGLTTMGRFRQAITSTIKTVTRLIMSQITWWLCPQRNTSLSTGKIAGCEHRKVSNILKIFAHWLLNGTEPKKGKSGIQNTVSALQNPYNPLTNNAFSVESPIKPKIDENQPDSVLTIVNQPIDGHKTQTLKSGSAQFVEPTFELIDTPKLAPVQPPVKATCCGNHVVYDLTIEGDHPEFFADGILVHNCMDGLRYGEITDPWGGGDIEHN